MGHPRYWCPVVSPAPLHCVNCSVGCGNSPAQAREILLLSEYSPVKNRQASGGTALGRIEEKKVRRETGEREEQEGDEEPAQENEHGVSLAEAPEQVAGDDVGKADSDQEDEDVGHEEIPPQDKGV